ncbi:MAG: F0F1 ATP synthase subunit B [Chloroflexota bacterium]
MDSLINVSPGLMIWTIINFLIFLLLIAKFALKPIQKSLAAREERIRATIESAEEANKKAMDLLAESQAKFDAAQQEVLSALAKGRDQAQAQIRLAADEAEKVKREKIDEAAREIERSKDAAIKELRGEVADLVVKATEKLLNEKIDPSKDEELIKSYIAKIPKN